ncbi:MAG: rhodanese-like domain-containing protein [Sulfolobales archaeon]|nr:rhodanese-like domain-containing protein [Sulfolobales archaeon]
MLINDQQATPFVKNVIDVLPSVARKLWKTGKAIVVDIRTPFEYVSHHIPGAVLVPMEHLEVLAHKVRDKDVIVVCEHGNRAFYATYGAPHLWKKAYYMIGGMAYWMSMGYEVTSSMDENGRLWQRWLEETRKGRTVREVV